MFGLPREYRENKVKSRDGNEFSYWTLDAKPDRWQVPAYKVAGKYIQENKIGFVVEIGCGLGQKAEKYLYRENLQYLGIDQGSAIKIAKKINTLPLFQWEELDLEEPLDLLRICKKFEPQLILMFDVIEHLDNPIPLLEILQKTSATQNALLFISTPNRERIKEARKFGPPINPLHVREWTRTEFEKLLIDSGFKIIKSWNLFPRSYAFSFQEVWTTLHKLLKLRSPIDRRYNQLHLVISNFEIHYDDKEQVGEKDSGI